MGVEISPAPWSLLREQLGYGGANNVGLLLRFLQENGKKEDDAGEKT